MAMTVSETRRFSEQAKAATSLKSRVRQFITAKTGLTSSGLILVAVTLFAWGLGRFVAGRPMYLLSYGGVTVLAISWFVGRRPLPVEGTRSFGQSRRSEGEIIDMTVGLTATRKLATFILEERVPPVLGQNARIPVASLEAGETVDHKYKITCWRRGVYELGPLVVKWGDPFGFTERERTLAEPYEFLVHPTQEQARDRPFTRLWEDPIVRPPITKPWPFGQEFYGMRNYTPGDDIRKVVWRAFARTGEILVKESEQGITDKITIILDQDRRNHSRGMFSESFEAGVRAVASIGVQHIKDGFSVDLHGNSKMLVGGLRGGTSYLKLLDELARVEMEETNLGDALHRVVFESGRDAHVAIVTPYLTDEAASRIQILRDRGCSVLVAALLWDELATESLLSATRLGCQVVEIRPNAPLAVAFRQHIG